jgi:hypothetical protein
MKKNIDPQEAQMRTLVAVLLLLVALFLESTAIRILLAVSSAILAGTAFLRSCPIYTLLGKNALNQETSAGDTEIQEQVQTESTAPTEEVTEGSEKTE